MIATEIPPSPNLSELNKVSREVPAILVASVTRLLRSVAGDEDHALLVARVLDALARSTSDHASRNWSLDDNPSDIAILVEWLNQPEVLADLRHAANPITVARLRGLAVRERLLAAEGGALSAQAMAKALGITRQAVDARRKKGALIGLTLGKRGFAYPSWQAGLEGLETVLAELRGYDPWTQLAFMLTPNVWLNGETPLAALRQGNVGLTADAARTYGEQVAA